MKQFILKNIVLVAVLAITLVGSVFLIFFIWSKSQTIQQSMEDIEADVEKLESINAARKPNSVEQSEKMIKADTETLNKKKDQIYRHFGRPYRPALLKLLKNIASTAELKTDLSLDSSLVAKPKPKTEEAEDGEAEVEETQPAESAEPAAPAVPTDEEKAVFDPASNRVVLSFDEDTLRNALADLYREIPQESSDESFMIPDTIQSERAQLFEKLFDRIIEAPEAVDPARAEEFRKAAAAKFARAFAIFREEVQELTLENVTYGVAHEIFLDALGLPRLMRQRVCRDYIDILYEKYLNADIIPSPAKEDPFDRTNRIQDLIYGKNVSKDGPIVADMVIPIIRNLQIKEDLFRRIKDSGISVLRGMSVGSFFGTTVDNDPEGPILLFSYTIDMTASMKAIDKFINQLHAAYKDDCVYVIKNISFSSAEDELIQANAMVARHTRPTDTPAAATAGKTGTASNQAGAAAATNANDAQQPVATVYSSSEYELSDPHNSDYGKVLVGEHPDRINCTIVVDYLYYRADNITPQ